MLPASYDYTLKFYSDLIEKDISFKCFVATIQFHCTTVGESKYWVSLFEKANKLSFKCLNAHSFENDGSKVIRSSDWCLLSFVHKILKIFLFSSLVAIPM